MGQFRLSQKHPSTRASDDSNCCEGRDADTNLLREKFLYDSRIKTKPNCILGTIKRISHDGKDNLKDCVENVLQFKYKLRT